ncbi:MAG: 50S ribosomal protein L30 [Bacteroidetes bacterium]|nr:MAG: 50S ribosomal protein L30 [Bacteroidota bacterium]
MKKLQIKQVKSKIGRPLRQKRTLEALGITKMNRVKEVEASPQVLGMIEKVKHLLSIEEV